MSAQKHKHWHETRLKSKYSDLWLDVVGVSKDNGAGVHQWTETDGENQVFIFKDKQDGSFEITAKHSGKNLTADGDGDGAKLIQNSASDEANQRWHVKVHSDGSYTISNVKNGKVIDVEGPSKEKGHKIHLWKDLEADNQKWIPSHPLPHAHLNGKTTRLIAKHSGMALDVSGVSKEDGAKIYQWEKHDGDNQKFTFHKNGDWAYTISAKHSGKLVTAHGTDKGSEITQEGKSGKEDQVFWVSKNSDGTYRITNQHSKMCIDVDGSSKEKGHKVQQWPPTDGDNQKWELIDL